jgi:hypothetical protein
LPQNIDFFSTSILILERPPQYRNDTIGGITIGSCQKVPTKRFLPKRYCKKSSCEKGSRDPKVPAKKVPTKKVPGNIGPGPYGSCQKVPVNNTPRSIWFLSKTFPGPYGSCQKYSQVHMAPRSKFLIFNSKFLK